MASEIKQEPFRLATEAIRFGLVGLLSAGIYFGSTLALGWYTGISLAAAGSISFSLVVAINYVLHHSWTFQSTRTHSIAVPRFVATTLGGLAVNVMVLTVGKHVSILPPICLLLIGGGCIVAWNYVMAKRWVF